MAPILLLLAMLAGITTYPQPAEQWYKVVASNSKIWSEGHNIHIIPLDGDSVLLSGFSNQGASVVAHMSQNRISVPKQAVTITPHGGYGKIQWEIIIEANGVVQGSAMVLQFSFVRDTFSTSGEITAVKCTEEQAGTALPQND